MSNCYYSYSFYLDDGLIQEEILEEHLASPMKAVGLEPPLDFDDFIDVWKSVCYPIFERRSDESKLCRKYFKRAYSKGVHSLSIELEHNPLKSTYATKYTRIVIELYEEDSTKRGRVNVMWEDNPELEKRKLQRAL